MPTKGCDALNTIHIKHRPNNLKSNKISQQPVRSYLLDKPAYDFAVSSPMHDDAHHGLVNVYPLPERNFFIDL